MPKRRPEARLPLGHVADAHGVRGWLKVQGEVQTLAELPSWWLAGAERRVELTHAHSGKLLAKLAGVDDRNQALALRGAVIEVPRAALPQPEAGTYYWSELIGLEVVNAKGVVLGKVAEVTSNGAHEVLALAGAGRDRLLPFVPSVVLQVELEQGRIAVEWDAEW